MEYDARIIEEFAARLYTRANSIILQYASFCAFLGLIGGSVVGFACERSGAHFTEIGAAVGAVLFGIVGYALGQEKAFQLRLQAQSALCQVRIERNTKRG